MTPWELTLQQLNARPLAKEEPRKRRVVSPRAKCENCGITKGVTAFRKLKSGVLTTVCTKCGG